MRHRVLKTYMQYGELSEKILKNQMQNIVLQKKH